MYVAPESKLLVNLANVTTASTSNEPVVNDPNDPSTWTMMPPCL